MVLSDVNLSGVSLRKERVEKIEYFGIIEDILKMQKNVCLCRHFQRLNKHSALGQFRKARSKQYDDSASDDNGFEDLWKGTIKESKKSYLDVWLVDFFSPSLTTNTSDTTSLFILQLACIVNMVPRWKKLKLRVFVIKPGSLNIEEKCNVDENISNDPKPKPDGKDVRSNVGK